MNKPVREGFVDDIQNEVVTPPPQLKTITGSAAAEPERPTYDELVAENKRLRAALEPPPPDQWPLVIKLRHKSIKTDEGNIVDKLSFREPTTMDIIRAGGNPVITEIGEYANGLPTFEFRIDDPKMFKMMASMAKIMDAFLEKMDPRDYASAAYRLRRFFVPEQGVW
jgi:hypothetical protein